MGNLQSQTGPGGVGNSTTNTLWLRASDIGQADGTSVASWPDNSGNNNDASQGVAGYQPTYETGEINGKAVVRFDGTDDHLDDARSYNARTIFVVYNILSANQATTDLGQLWGNYAEGVHIAQDARGAGGTWSFDANGGVSNTGRLGQNGAAYGAFNANPGTPTWTYDQFDLVTAEFNATRSLTRQVIGSLVPSFGIGVHQFGGDIAEIIVYNTTLNTAQRIIVENYLAAKYNLTISNDNYIHQASHGNEVAGIGRATAGNEHTSATSSDILRIENASSLGDGDYLFFGHDNGSIASWSTTESPDGGTYIQRLQREWILDETNDVGTVDVIVDVSSLPAQPGSHDMYALLVDSDGDFSSGASVYELPLSGGSEYAITGLDISDGQYFAIASMQGIADHSLATAFGPEPNDAVLTVNLNYIPESDVTVDYTTADGTATTAGPDYTGATPGTMTITAGNTSGSYTVTINNDVSPENDETFTITLSNPSSGSVGINSVVTYSIQDDDKARKIYFDANSSSNLESVTSGTIAVSLSSVDAINPTTVDYSILSGTATGSGTDYTLAAGTLTITAGSTTNTIPFTVNNEGLYEHDETFVVLLSNPSNGNLDVVMPYAGTGIITHTYTIQNDDPAPTIQFNSTSSSGSESSTPASFQIDLSTASGADAVVSYSLSGTATGSGTDYILANGTFTIPAGSTSGSISAVIVDDSNEELPETIILTIYNPTDATLGGNTAHTYIINDDDNIGRDGPGGIGKTSNLALWLRGDDIAQADLTSVASWSDQSGNSNDATQGTGASQPTYRTNIANGHDVVRFDGVDDFFSDSRSYSARTVFVVYQMLSANQNTGDLAQPWGSYGEGVQVSLDARSGGGSWSFDANNSQSNTGKFAINGAAYGAFGANPGSPSWSYDVFQMVAVEFNDTRAVTSQDIGSLISPTGHYLGADLAELFVYNIQLDNADRNIIENYLSAKYNIAITTDLYAYDSPGNYEFEVAGIGREDANNFHIDTKGSGEVRILNPDDLDDDEYLLFGHDDGAFIGSETTDVPGSMDARLERVWRASEVNTSGTAVDVGGIDIHFDLTGLSVGSASDLRLLIDSDNDGAFSDETPISGAAFISGETYGFSGITGISNGLRFTLGTADATSTPLPIELLSFTGEGRPFKQVELRWSTSSEINNDFFTLERSKNGTDWQVIHSEPGAGNSSVINHYLHIDYLDDSLADASTIYYKLRQTDYDGTIKYYGPIAIKINKSVDKGNISIKPNPTRGNLNIDLENLALRSPAEEIKVIINTLDGKIVFEESLQHSYLADLSFEINFNLPSGMYYLSLHSEQEVLGGKMFINR